MKILHFFILIATWAALTGCSGSQKTVYIPVHTAVHDTLREVVYHKDSVILHDSVFMNTYWMGDTLVQYKYTERVELRDRWHTDTVNRSHTDTIAQPYPVYERVEVEKPLTHFQQFRMGLGTMLCYLLIIIAGILVFRWYKGK